MALYRAIINYIVQGGDILVIIQTKSSTDRLKILDSAFESKSEYDVVKIFDISSCAEDSIPNRTRL